MSAFIHFHVSQGYNRVFRAILSYSGTLPNHASWILRFLHGTQKKAHAKPNQILNLKILNLKSWNFEKILSDSYSQKNFWFFGSFGFPKFQYLSGMFSFRFGTYSFRSGMNSYLSGIHSFRCNFSHTLPRVVGWYHWNPQNRPKGALFRGYKKSRIFF